MATVSVAVMMMTKGIEGMLDLKNDVCSNSESISKKLYVLVTTENRIARTNMELCYWRQRIEFSNQGAARGSNKNICQRFLNSYFLLNSIVAKYVFNCIVKLYT